VVADGQRTLAGIGRHLQRWEVQRTGLSRPSTPLLCRFYQHQQFWKTIVLHEKRMIRIYKIWFFPPHAALLHFELQFRHSMLWDRSWLHLHIHVKERQLLSQLIVYVCLSSGFKLPEVSCNDMYSGSTY
jgi:hypothetical protein